MNKFLPRRYKVSGNPLITERKFELVAVVLSIILVLQLIYCALRMLMLSAPVPLVPAAESLAFSQVQSVQAVSVMQSNETVARPLFWPSRRPIDSTVVVEDTPSDGKPTGELASVSLTGVFGGGESAGIIAVVDDKKHRVLVGEKLFDWTLDSMGLEHATFIRKGETQKLELNAASKSVKTKKRDNKMRKRKL